jgi:hypothetical protein
LPVTSQNRQSKVLWLLIKRPVAKDTGASQWIQGKATPWRLNLTDSMQCQSAVHT